MPAVKSYLTLSCVQWSWYQMFRKPRVQQPFDVGVMSLLNYLLTYSMEQSPS